MPIFKRIAAILIIVAIAGTIFFGYTYAKKNIESAVSRFSEDSLDSRLTIGSIGFGFPLCLDIRDIKFNDTLDIPHIRIYPNPASFFLRKNIIISRVNIVDPVLAIGDIKNLRFGIKGSFLDKISLPGVLLSKLRIKNGTLIYEGLKGKDLEFINIRGDVDSPGLYLSGASTFRFALAGFFKGKNLSAPLKIDGYFGPDEITKARLSVKKVNIEDLGPIYEKYLSKRFLDGKISMESDVEISSKTLIAKCYLEAEDVVIKNDPVRKMDVPLVASFIVVINFNTKAIKLKKLQGNFFDIIFGRS